MLSINVFFFGWRILAQPGGEGQRVLYERLEEVCSTVKLLH